LAFKKFPQIFLKETVEHANEWVKFAVKQADRIITVSHNTRKDLLTLFDTDEDKIRVIYEGVSSDYHPIRDPDLLERLRRKYALPEKFILFVGTIEPRKNLVRLLEAFNKFKKNKSAAYRLVIAGGKGWLYDDVFETVEKLELQQDVIFTGYIPESELPLMYNLSDLFIYPSLYEGFGLPLLEAMACGIPVISSRVSSVPEVAGNAALLIDPYDSDELTEAMSCVLEDRQVKERMIENGLMQTKEFTWEKTALETMNVYEELV
jgi:glycosyltransferase involved in cell wall biosynthesis